MAKFRRWSLTRRFLYVGDPEGEGEPSLPKSQPTRTFLSFSFLNFEVEFPNSNFDFYEQRQLLEQGESEKKTNKMIHNVHNNNLIILIGPVLFLAPTVVDHDWLLVTLVGDINF